jgi:O-acetylhomoserine/O-acetylserine sulfhydrylase
VLLPRFGVTTRFIRSGKPEEFSASIDDKTMAIYVESISNPDYIVPDFEEIAKIAHDHGIPLIVSLPLLLQMIVVNSNDS